MSEGVPLSKHVILERDEKGRIKGRDLGACSVCGEPAKSKGMCRKHYHAEWLKLNPGYEKRRKRDPASRKAIIRRYYLKNRQAILDRQARAYAQDPDRFLERCEKWRKENPEVARMIGARRRSRERGAEGSHTTEQLRELYERQQKKCACCRVLMPQKKFTVDHILALSRGGSNYIDNIQLLCSTCNKSKGAKDNLQFMQSRGLLL